MSLAPSERRALGKIEDGLRRSDWQLARMLTRFKVPLARGGLVILVRRPRRHRRHRRLIAAAVAVTALALLVVTVLRSPTTPLTCSPPSGTGSAAAAAQASNCPLALHRGHAPSTAVTIMAK